MPSEEDKNIGTIIPKSTFGRQLLAQEFSLKPGYVYCNNGAYGQVPKRVLKEQMKLMNEREEDPEMWYRYNRERDLYFTAVTRLAEFVGSDPSNLVLVENASTGSNNVLRSISLNRGDKILVTSHTYAAVLKNVKVVESDIPGVEGVHLDLELPIMTDEDVIVQYERVIRENEGIKVAILDHITSPSAIMVPIKALIDLCHKRDILVLIDGAHVPGHLPLRLDELGADFYVGNIHKWLFAPRGCALLWVHPKHHAILSPLVVSHNHLEKTMADRFVPSATRDSIPYLVVPNALDFHNSLGGLSVIQGRNAELASTASKMLSESWGTEELPVAKHLRSPNMALVALPPVFQDNFPPDEDSCVKLMEKFHKKNLAVCVTPVQGKLWIRLSVHVWNGMEDYVVVKEKILELEKQLKCTEKTLD